MLKRKKKKKEEKPVTKKSNEKKRNAAELQNDEYNKYINRVKEKAMKHTPIIITNIVWHAFKK